MIQTVIKLKTNEALYLKDPAESAIGKKIIQRAAEMISKMGYEEFTFKKLAVDLQTTEATLYRYFENKQKLLLYISSWYWAYLSYKVNYETHLLKNSQQKLNTFIHILCINDDDENLLEYFRLKTLKSIVISEAPKAYFQRNIDEVNKDGAFREFKNLSLKLAEIIKDINPRFKYPNSMASTIIEVAHQQIYFAEHLPSLSDVKSDKRKDYSAEDFIKFIINKIL
jgi:AcrR family transcriptional regulator